MGKRTDDIKATHAALQDALAEHADAIIKGSDQAIDETREKVIRTGIAHRAALIVPHVPECIFTGEAQPWENGEMVKLIVTHLTLLHKDPEMESGMRVDSRELAPHEAVEFYTTRAIAREKFGLNV
jgi:hypothetical protein